MKPIKQITMTVALNNGGEVTMVESGETAVTVTEAMQRLADRLDAVLWPMTCTEPGVQVRR